MVGVIIQARMGSTRLPGKSLFNICGNPLLYYSATRATLAKYPAKVVIATTINKEDDVIMKWCQETSFDCYRGNEVDVLDRYYQCAKLYGFNIIVRITADNPFIDPTIVDMLITTINTYSKDYITMRDNTNTWPYGLDVEVVTFKALKKAWLESKITYHREHVTTYIKDNPALFSAMELSFDKNIADIRITVDTKRDFDNASLMLESLLTHHGIKYTWQDVCDVYTKLIKGSI